MRELPIIMSTPMIQAILEGRKTRTRRIIRNSFNGPHPCPNDPVVFYPGEKIEHPEKEGEYFTCEDKEVQAHFFCSTMNKIAKCPYGAPGDNLWVREKWAPNSIPTGWRYHYYANNDTVINPDEQRWEPSIHMPKEAARIWLGVENIRVERLLDINEREAIAEGVQKVGDGYMNYTNPDQIMFSPIISFLSLWEKINGLDSLDSNPWVWVFEFKVHTTGGKIITKRNGHITVPAWSLEYHILHNSPHNADKNIKP